jgi:DNA-binding NarL/FixJ family response regulator
VILDGHAAATPTLQRAAIAVADLPLDEVLRWGWMATTASALVWDLDAMDRISSRQVQVVRDAGAFGALPIYLSQLGIARPWMGDLTGTASLVTEVDNVAAATGSPIAPYTLLRLLALEGRHTEAMAAIAAILGSASAQGQGMATVWAQWTAAILHNGSSHYEEAATAAQQATSGPYPWPSMWALPELVEAAAHTGNTDLARDALDRLMASTQACANDVALGIEARCRALLSAADVAERAHREAIDRLGRTRLRPELARAHLLYGEWLRREGRRADARLQLRTAHDLLSAIGMEAFAERARRELLATGETARKRTDDTRTQLTPQEVEIAQLARDGLSNPEIGTQLFISARTVEWHLRNVYTKVGIRSRRELRAALPEHHRISVDAP